MCSQVSKSPKEVLLIYRPQSKYEICIYTCTHISIYLAPEDSPTHILQALKTTCFLHLAP